LVSRDEARPEDGSVPEDRTCPFLKKRRGGSCLFSSSNTYLLSVVLRELHSSVFVFFFVLPPPPSFLGFTVADIPLFSYIGTLIV
jgi:hypothetical protein